MKLLCQRLLALALGLPVMAQAAEAPLDVAAAAAAITPKVIEWRRDFHQHPELGNREFRTSAKVAEHLRGLGLEVRTGLAHTGVIGILRGAQPGPTVMLRADMDALPVKEKTDVPFHSTATAEFRGNSVGVMHACGHDSHTAILMGAAEILAARRESLPGTVLFVFQPAEEGAPEGEEGGAPLMLKEGLFDILRPDAAFGLHVHSTLATGTIGIKPGPFMAGSDFFTVVVKGRQTHGSRPWGGIDPIVAAAQIINSLQTVVSRQTDITRIPAVVSIGAINGGVRHNIIPDQVEMLGTIRTFDPAVRLEVIEHMRRIINNVAAANGATAEFQVEPGSNPVTANDPALTERMVPVLRRALGDNAVRAIGLQTGAEDFAFFAREVPSLFFWVGITPPGQDLRFAPSNHSDFFYLDEGGIPVGLRALLAVTLDFLHEGPQAASAR